MFRELILSHMGYDPGLRKLVQEEQAACYMLPLGNLMKLFQAIAGGLPGAIATTGLGTFADPPQRRRQDQPTGQRHGQGSGLPHRVGRKGVPVLSGLSLDVCFLRATYGDEAGNLSIRNEAMNVEQFEVAAAVHNAGGIVIAQVDQIVKRGHHSGQRGPHPRVHGGLPGGGPPGVQPPEFCQRPVPPGDCRFGPDPHGGGAPPGHGGPGRFAAAGP